MNCTPEQLQDVFRRIKAQAVSGPSYSSAIKIELLADYGTRLAVGAPVGPLPDFLRYEPAESEESWQASAALLSGAKR
jgi:hypothetical protein